MAAQAAANSIEPAFGLGDRLEKARRHCGIKSAADMAERLNERLGDRLRRPIKTSTVNAWEAGTNQPTMIRMEELISVWIDICNEAGAAIGHSVSAEFIYGLRNGSFAPSLTVLPEVTGQGTLLTSEGEPAWDFDTLPFLTSVPCPV